MPQVIAARRAAWRRLRRPVEMGALRGGRRRGRPTPSRRGAFGRWPWGRTSLRGGWPRKPVAWAGRPGATLCTVLTRMGWPCWPASALRPAANRTGNAPGWRSGCQAAPTARQTGWRAAPIRATPAPRGIHLLAASLASGSILSRMRASLPESRPPRRSCSAPRSMAKSDTDRWIKSSLLHFSGIAARPLHPRSGLEAPVALTKTLPARQRAAIPELAGRRSKSGFKTKPPFALPKRFALRTPWRIPPGPESQGTPTRIWAKQHRAHAASALRA
jgi:hypothetical protein